MLSKSAVNLLWLFLLLTGSLFAVDGKVRVFIKSDKTVYTSQKVTVAVELLSNAFSITDASIRFPSTDSYIVQAPQSAAYLGREEVDGEEWQMIHYEYEVYPLRAGKLKIAPLSVSFSASMGYGQPKKRFELRSKALQFDVKAPKGVKNDQFVLVTDCYKVTSERQPLSTRLIIGDAVTLTVTQHARGVPDILLPPVTYASSTFLRVYEKEPVLQSGMKGEYDVSRTDSFTFVAAQEGNVTVPAQKILWWNRRTETLQHALIPAMHFEIIPDPQIEIDAKRAAQKRQLILIAGTAVGLLLFGWLLYPWVQRYLKARKKAYEISEKGRFDALLYALKTGDLAQSYRLFYLWLAEIDPALEKEGFRGIGEQYPFFNASLQAFEMALSGSGTPVDIERFIQESKAFRRALLHRKQAEHASLPGRLNP